MHPPFSFSLSLSANMSSRVALQCMLLMLSIAIATSDVDKDKEKCATDLVGLATCLPYVSGDSKAKAPPIDCCTGLKQVLDKSPECVCLLVKDRNDPTLGLNINATLALGLPSRCHAPANVTNCPALLHLAPNSPDAKVFQDFANIGHKTNASAPATANPSDGNTTTTTAAATANEKSDGRKQQMGWFGVEMVSGLLLTILALHFL